MFLYLGVVFVLILCLYLWENRARSLPGALIGTDFAPWFGSLFNVQKHRDNFHDWMVHINENIVKPGQSWTGGMPFRPPFLWIGADPASVEHVLKTNFWNYEKGEFFHETMDVFLGTGIFNVDGEQWKHQRKVASHMFSARSLKEDMSLVFLQNSKKVHAIIQRFAASQSIFDVQDLYFRYTLESFTDIAFGEKLGTLGHRVDEHSNSSPLKQQHKYEAPSVPFATAFDTVQMIANNRFFDPSWKLRRFLNIGDEKLLKQQVAVIHDFGQKIIRRKLKEEKKERSSKPDLLSRFIQYAEEHGETMDQNHLNFLAMNFIIAGRDTTACLLSWATYELSRHPEFEQRLYEEVLTLPELDNSQNAISAGDYATLASSLPLMHAFLMETLRLHPSVPQDVKQAVGNDVLPSGIAIPKGTMIVYNPYVMGRSTHLWGEDALSFRPDRWLEMTEQPSQYKFPVFNAGPRLCLGRSVALMEASLLMSLLIKDFKFVTVDENVTYLFTLTLPVKNGLHVRAQARS